MKGFKAHVVADKGGTVASVHARLVETGGVACHLCVLEVFVHLSELCFQDFYSGFDEGIEEGR